MYRIRVRRLISGTFFIVLKKGFVYNKMEYKRRSSEEAA